MSREAMGEQIAKTREILALEPLPPQSQASLDQTLTDLELQLQSQEPVDFERMVDMLRDAEAELEVDHPVVASVLGGLVRILASMGV